MKGYLSLRKYVLNKLKADLPAHLTYHGIDHTLDVLEVCEQYIRRLNLGEEERYLLRIGALVHDMGFLVGPSNHEEVGAAMSSDLMLKLSMNESQIEEVRGLVLATKIPQSPKNELQKIICDADLDYLGRDDYPQISQRLYEEFKFMKVVQTDEDWKQLQINFLKAHYFHTPFAIAKRAPKKQYWLNKLLDS
jgi:predicted metal-dependent HD superfamily phosphohydrolase